MAISSDAMSDDGRDRRAAQGWWGQTALITAGLGVFLVLAGEWRWGVWLLIISVVSLFFWRRVQRD
jgi:hypothetical protein